MIWGVDIFDFFLGNDQSRFILVMSAMKSKGGLLRFISSKNDDERRFNKREVWIYILWLTVSLATRKQHLRTFG